MARPYAQANESAVLPLRLVALMLSVTTGCCRGEVAMSALSERMARIKGVPQVVEMPDRSAPAATSACITDSGLCSQA